MTSLAARVFVVLTLFLAGCRSNNSSAGMQDLLGSMIDQSGYSDGGPVDFIKVAPIVVLSTVISNESVGHPQDSLRVKGYQLQLHKVTARREETLRNDLKGVNAQNVEFYYFASVEPESYQPFHKFFFKADKGGTYLFFLMREGEYLRSVADVGSYSIPVYGGLYPRDPNRKTTFGLRLSEVLLHWGDGADEKAFASSLRIARNIADQVGSRYETVKLLQSLLNQSSLIRAAACEELNRAFRGQYRCLEALKDDQQQTAKTKDWAVKRLAEVSSVEQRLKGELKDPSLISDYDELRILLEHPDPEYERRACVAVRRYYPRSEAAQCRTH